MAAKTEKSETITFSREKSTKNKQRFREDGGDPKIGILYVVHEMDEKLGKPKSIEVKVTAK